MKKHVVFSLLLLGCTVHATAQSTGHVDSRTRSHWQVETSLNYNSANSLHAISILYVDGAADATQTERAAFYAAVTRLQPIAPRLEIHYGLSLSDRGYRENLERNDASGFYRSHNNIRMTYLGTPVSVAYSLTDNRRFASGFLETGLLPEFLLHHNEGEYMNYDLRNVAFSGFAKAGMQLNFRGGHSLVMGPGVQFALGVYDRNDRSEPGQAQDGGGLLLRDYRPLAVNFSVGFRF